MVHRLDTAPPGRPRFRTIIALTGLIIVWGLSMPVIKLAF